MDPKSQPPTFFLVACAAIALLAIASVFFIPKFAHPASYHTQPISTPAEQGAAAPGNSESDVQCALLTAKWCGACRRFERERLAEFKLRLAAEQRQLRIVNVDAEPDQAEAFLSSAEGATLPAIVAFRERVSESGQIFRDIFGRVEGALPVNRIMDWLHSKAEAVKANRADAFGAPATSESASGAAAAAGEPQNRIGILRRRRAR